MTAATQPTEVSSPRVRKPKFSDVTGFVLEGYRGISKLSANGSPASKAYALGEYLFLANIQMPFGVNTPATGARYGEHFYLEPTSAASGPEYIVTQYDDEEPIVWRRANGTGDL